MNFKQKYFSNFKQNKLVPIINLFYFSQILANKTIQSILKCESIGSVIYVSTKPRNITIGNFMDLIRLKKKDKEDKTLSTCKFFYPKYAIPIDLNPHSIDVSLIVRFDR